MRRYMPSSAARLVLNKLLRLGLRTASMEQAARVRAPPSSKEPARSCVGAVIEQHGQRGRFGCCDPGRHAYGADTLIKRALQIYVKGRHSDAQAADTRTRAGTLPCCWARAAAGLLAQPVQGAWGMGARAAEPATTCWHSARYASPRSASRQSRARAAEPGRGVRHAPAADRRRPGPPADRRRADAGAGDPPSDSLRPCRCGNAALSVGANGPGASGALSPAHVPLNCSTLMARARHAA